MRVGRDVLTVSYKSKSELIEVSVIKHVKIGGGGYNQI